MGNKTPDGTFKNPFPPITNERVLAGLDAMGMERFAELLGWPKDFLGRYKNQGELRQFRMIFNGYLKGVAGGEPPYASKSLQSALGGFLNHLWENQPGAASFLKYVDSYRIADLVDLYERDRKAT